MNCVGNLKAAFVQSLTERYHPYEYGSEQLTFFSKISF